MDLKQVGMYLIMLLVLLLAFLDNNTATPYSFISFGIYFGLLILALKVGDKW